MLRLLVPYKRSRQTAAMVADLPRDFSVVIVGHIYEAEDMGTPSQFNVGDRVALRGSSGGPDPKMIGVIEKVEFQIPPGNGADDCFYVVRRSNGKGMGRYFAARQTELVRFVSAADKTPRPRKHDARLA